MTKLEGKMMTKQCRDLVNIINSVDGLVAKVKLNYHSPCIFGHDVKAVMKSNGEELAGAYICSADAPSLEAVGMATHILDKHHMQSPYADMAIGLLGACKKYWESERLAIDSEGLGGMTSDAERI